MKYQTIKNIVRNDSLYIPDFIDPRIEEHHHCYKIMASGIYPIIMKMCDCNFLSHKGINDQYNYLIIHLNEIKYTSPDELYIVIYSHIMRKLDEYISYAQDLEHYETAQNLNYLRGCLVVKKQLYDG